MPRTPDPARRQLWQERFARFDTSGLTVAQFCRQEGVSPPSFYQWKKKLAASESTPNHGAFDAVSQACLWEVQSIRTYRQQESLARAAKTKARRARRRKLNRR